MYEQDAPDGRRPPRQESLQPRASQVVGPPASRLPGPLRRILGWGLAYSFPAAVLLTIGVAAAVLTLLPDTSGPHPTGEPSNLELRSSRGAALPASSNSKVLILTHPSRASVRIDREPVGKTPLHVYKPADVYLISVRKTAYAPLDTFVYVPYAEPAVLHFFLRPENAVAHADQSSSEPDGAVETRPPRKAPVRKTRREASERHRQTNRSTEPSRKITPEPATTTMPSTGKLWVTSEPLGATVQLDGRAVGKTPLQIHGVSAGKHHIALVAKDYLQHGTSVRVHRQQTTSLFLKLQQRPCRLTIDVKPRGILIIDGHAYAASARESYTVTLEPGKHHIRLTHPTLGRQETELECTANANRRMSFDLFDSRERW